ncbi:MAG: hypothetical protein KGR98_12510, partial [Verrucomicrobia bacterium]|nr:hypothetical protein [Verrucomicrobiota bacterium]
MLLEIFSSRQRGFYPAVNRNSNQSGRGADAASVNQTTKNPDSFFGVQFIHRNGLCVRGQAV